LSGCSCSAACKSKTTRELVLVDHPSVCSSRDGRRIGRARVSWCHGGLRPLHACLTELPVPPPHGVLRRGLADLHAATTATEGSEDEWNARVGFNRRCALGGCGLLTARTRYQSTKCGRPPRGERRRCGHDANADDAAHTSRAACALSAAAVSASRSRPAPAIALSPGPAPPSPAQRNAAASND